MNRRDGPKFNTHNLLDCTTSALDHDHGKAGHAPSTAWGLTIAC